MRRQSLAGRPAGLAGWLCGTAGASLAYRNEVCDGIEVGVLGRLLKHYGKPGPDTDPCYPTRGCPLDASYRRLPDALIMPT